MSYTCQCLCTCVRVSFSINGTKPFTCTGSAAPVCFCISASINLCWMGRYRTLCNMDTGSKDGHRYRHRDIRCSSYFSHWICIIPGGAVWWLIFLAFPRIGARVSNMAWHTTAVTPPCLMMMRLNMMILITPLPHLNNTRLSMETSELKVQSARKHWPACLLKRKRPR